MPRSLKLYIAGLVAASAVALLATGFAFPFDPSIAIQLDADPVTSGPELTLGIAFWTVVTLVASALPVRMPRDRKSTRLNSSHMSESRMPSSA